MNAFEISTWSIKGLPGDVTRKAKQGVEAVSNLAKDTLSTVNETATQFAIKQLRDAIAIGMIELQKNPIPGVSPTLIATANIAGVSLQIQVEVPLKE
jgi:hypothetical protein